MEGKGELLAVYSVVTKLYTSFHTPCCCRECFIPRYVGPTMDMVKLDSIEDMLSLPLTSWNIRQPGRPLSSLLSPLSSLPFPFLLSSLLSSLLFSLPFSSLSLLFLPLLFFFSSLLFLFSFFPFRLFCCFSPRHVYYVFCFSLSMLSFQLFLFPLFFSFLFTYSFPSSSLLFYPLLYPLFLFVYFSLFFSFLFLSSLHFNSILFT